MTCRKLRIKIFIKNISLEYYNDIYDMILPLLVKNQIVLLFPRFCNFFIHFCCFAYFLIFRVHIKVPDTFFIGKFG